MGRLPSYDAPKGPNTPAQGNALGYEGAASPQRYNHSASATPGVALGWRVPAFQAERTISAASMTLPKRITSHGNSLDIGSRPFLLSRSLD